MKLIAKDSFYTDETKHVAAKSVFSVDSPETAKSLIERGLALDIKVDETEVVDALDHKQESAPLNKAEPKPSNKSKA
jgi:hypothetical protein